MTEKKEIPKGKRPCYVKWTNGHFRWAGARGERRDAAHACLLAAAVGRGVGAYSMVYSDIVGEHMPYSLHTAIHNTDIGAGDSKDLRAIVRGAKTLRTTLVVIPA